MKTPMTRWTVTAVAVVALAASILVLEKTTPFAFGLDQVIAAAKGVRTLHIKTQGTNNSAPNRQAGGQFGRRLRRGNAVACVRAQ